MDTCEDQVRWDFAQMIATAGSLPASAHLRAEVAMRLARRYAAELTRAVDAGDYEAGIGAAHRASAILTQRRLLAPVLESADPASTQ